MILITGAGGMLGGYLLSQFEDKDILTLGKNLNNDFSFNLSETIPNFENKFFSTVIHAAGTENEADAMQLNFEGTKNLLKALDKNPPDNFVYISSYKVYSRDAGENVNEGNNTWATDIVGKSKALAESELREWCKENNVTLTIIRPARMFGNGVGGDTLQLFNDAVSGKYIHLRGNDARVSLVTAYDVARAIKRIYKKGGLYNAADGKNPKLLEMVEAMTANAGATKRMTHLPSLWAEWIWRLGRWIPSINRNLAPEVVEERMKTLTLDGSLLAKIAGLEYYDTIMVMQLSDPNYPYSYLNESKKATIHEV